jgi:hypothetical protein
MLYNISKNGTFTIITANRITHNDMHGDCNILYELPTDKKLHIYTLKNMHYLPSLKHLLILSLRQLLNNSLHIEGITDDLIILHDNEPVFHFTAEEEYNSLYYLSDLRRLETKCYENLFITMDLAYKCFVHPSKKMLHKFPLTMLGFPAVDGKLLTAPCSGCVQGKIDQHTYSPSIRHVSKSFELIHSDFKSFLVELYHQYKYVIVFYDNYSLYTWISCL